MSLPSLDQPARESEPLSSIEHRSYSNAEQDLHDLYDLYGPKLSHSYCLNSPGRLVNCRTGQSIQAGCRRATCVACNRVYARTYRDAMCITRPTHSIRMTGVYESWADTRSRMQGWLKRMRSTGREVNFDYAVERNPQDTGFHIHGWFYGSVLSSLSLNAHALSAGLVNTHLQPVTYRGNFAYPLKAATWNAVSLADFRLINGKHRHHPTRPFWRDARTDEEYPSMDDAATDWRALKWGEKKEIWTFEPSRRRSPGVLTPSAAARIRASNGGGCDRIDIETGEVLSTGRGVGDLDHGRVGQIRPPFNNTPDGLRLVDDGVLLPVTPVGG